VVAELVEGAADGGANVAHPRPSCLQHQAVFTDDQPHFQLDRPASQSKGLLSARGGDGGEQRVGSCLQHESLFAVDQSRTRPLRQSKQPRPFCLQHQSFFAPDHNNAQCT